MNTAEFWASAVAAAAVAVVLGELIDVGAWLAPRIIHRASANMPTPELQARYHEEWLAELEQFDGLKLVKLAKAVSLWANSWRIRNAWQSDRAADSLAVSIRSLIRGVSRSARAVRLGKPLSEPDMDRLIVMFPMVLDLVVVPTSAPASLIIKSGGAQFKASIERVGEYEASKHAKWLMPTGRILAVGFFDAYLLRTGTRLREIRKLHTRAYQAINFDKEKSD